MKLSEEWEHHINTEMAKPYMVELRKFINERRSKVNVFPPAELTFNAFVQCPYNRLQVIILGHEPSQSPGSAHGLAFSTTDSNTPAALKNIFKEVFEDYFQGNTGNITVIEHNDLTQWARQGVLLWNSVATCEPDEKVDGKTITHSHKNKGWETFTENTIMLINQHKHKLVFMLWGKEAQRYKQFIDPQKHLILESDHPGSAAYTAGKWFGNRHFSKANEFVKKHYFNIKPIINWGVFNSPKHVNLYE